MSRSVLIVDAVINLVLGILLLWFPPSVVAFLGLPPADPAFYPNILGAVFIGITIALAIGAFGGRSHPDAGLGLFGAVSINLCGGAVLALWLIFGHLALPVRGLAILWSLVGLLIVLSLVELIHSLRRE
jgi:hypothetical protein